MTTRDAQKEIDKKRDMIAKLRKDNDRIGQAIKSEERGRTNFKSFPDADSRIARSKSDVKRMRSDIERNLRTISSYERIIHELQRMR
ncbi:MAG: hypothetical protein Q8K58_10245 [Acidimicrobiales bacterium]|nr:hypothetical protein [Acidimicrobiales bacterium]